MGWPRATPEEKGHSSCDLMIRLSLCPHRVVHLDFVRKCSPILTISCISCHDALEPPCTHTRPRPSGLKGKIKEGRKGGWAKESARGGRAATGNGFSIQHQINVGRGLQWPAPAQSVVPMPSMVKDYQSTGQDSPQKLLFMYYR